MYTSEKNEVTTSDQPIHLRHGAHHTGKQTDADMQHWRKYDLGQFIHWGVYSIQGGE